MTLLAPAAASAATWSVQTGVNPANVASASLAGVSCTGARACQAVGRWTDTINGTTLALAEAWDGTNWTLQTPALPSGAVSTEFLGVSCTAANACTAVGWYDDGSGTAQSLVERWDGSRWTVQASPNPSGSQGTYLLGVSCISSTECTAVGSWVDSGVEKTLAMRWTSGRWTIQTSANVSMAPSTRLASVSCTTATTCIAVGSSTNGLGVGSTLSETVSSGTWSIQSTPNASGADSSYLSSVSCKATGSCTAVGGSNTSGVSAPLAMVLSSGTWLIQTTSTPRGASGALLTGVSCGTTTVCTSVGYSFDSMGVYSPLAEDRSGSTWTIVATATPGSSTGSRLFGASCSASAVCTGVGSLFDLNSEERVLVERYQ